MSLSVFRLKLNRKVGLGGGYKGGFLGGCGVDSSCSYIFWKSSLNVLSLEREERILEIEREKKERKKGVDLHKTL